MNTQRLTNPELNWIRKLDINATSYLELSHTNKIRFELMRYFHQLEESGKPLYFFSVTYKPLNCAMTPDIANRDFTRFYLRTFLPIILQTKNCNRSKYRNLQPITYAFLEDHKPKGVKDPSNPNVTVLETRLHHHAICAIHPETLTRFKELEGENTLIEDSETVGTTDLKRCDVGAVSYATKMMWKHPLELVFSPTTK